MMKALRFVFQAGLLALCLIPVSRQLTRDGAEVVDLASALNLAAVAASSALLALASLCLPVAMAAFARGGSHPKRNLGPVSLRASALAYFGSQPMKYLPGGFWVLPGRVLLLQRMGYDPAVSAGGLLFEMAAQALSGALVAAALLAAAPAVATSAPAGTAAGVWIVLGGSALGCGLLLACPAVLGRWRRLPASIREAAGTLAEITIRRRLANLVVTLLAFSAMWLLTGVGFYLLLVADAPRFSATLLLTAVGVSTLSSLAGFLTPFSPGGIGVREAAVVLLLAAAVTTAPQATLVALLSRVLALAVEMGFAAAAWAVMRARDLTALHRPAMSTRALSASSQNRLTSRSAHGRNMGSERQTPAVL